VAGFASGPRIELARTLLRARLAGGDAAYDRAAALLAETKLIHPMEGSIAIKSMPAEHRSAFGAALREILAWAAATTRALRRRSWPRWAVKPTPSPAPSWPFVTVFAGLYTPSEHVFVKPKLLLEQAAISAFRSDYDPLPSGKAYEQLREDDPAAHVLRLVEAGQAPRDLAWTRPRSCYHAGRRVDGFRRVAARLALRQQGGCSMQVASTSPDDRTDAAHPACSGRQGLPGKLLLKLEFPQPARVGQGPHRLNMIERAEAPAR